MTAPPTFHTSVEVDAEVSIDPDDLEEAGWVYVGPDPGPTTEHVLDVVKRWHEDAHTDVWRFCDHELCRQLNDRTA